jgi:hypothetical protein
MNEEDERTYYSLCHSCENMTWRVLTDARGRYHGMQDATGRTVFPTVEPEDTPMDAAVQALDTLRVRVNDSGHVCAVLDAWGRAVPYTPVPAPDDHPAIGTLSEEVSGGTSSGGGGTRPPRCTYCTQPIDARRDATTGQWLVARCAQCRAPAYCNEQCARRDWTRGHARICRPPLSVPQ